MPSHKNPDPTTAAAAEQEALTRRLVERAQLELLDEMLKGDGPTRAWVLQNTDGRPEVHARFVAQASARIGELARDALGEQTRRLAGQLQLDPRAGVFTPRHTRATPSHDHEPAVDAWKYVELHVDRVECVKETYLEKGADEMFIVGRMFPVDDADAARDIDFSLGSYHTGDVNGFSGTRMIQRVSIAKSAKFPTRVVCILSVIERDSTGAFRKFVKRVLDAIENALAAETDDKQPPSWWESVREAAESVVEWLIQLFGAPDPLVYDDEEAFSFESPKILGLADSWPADHASDGKTFRVQEPIRPKRAGKYDIRLLFKRAK